MMMMKMMMRLMMMEDNSNIGVVDLPAIDDNTAA